MPAGDVGKTYTNALNSAAPQARTINFHAAAIDRLFELAWLNPDLTDDQRKACVVMASHWIGIVDALWASDAKLLTRFHDALDSSLKYFAAFGSATSREWMRDRGLSKF